jgi:hypothetical protein
LTKKKKKKKESLCNRLQVYHVKNGELIIKSHSFMSHLPQFFYFPYIASFRLVISSLGDAAGRRLASALTSQV